nr:SLC13 family permease [Pectobacterium colocasium]
MRSDLHGAHGLLLGQKEEKRLGLASGNPLAGSSPSIAAEAHVKELTDAEKALRRPKMFWVNIALVLAVIGTMVFTKISPTVAFMIALTLALMFNYPNVEMQKERINAHAKAALMMASILFAAGAFTGIMSGTGMLKAMSLSAVSFVPESFASHIPFIVGLISMPLSLVFDPDSYYFGIMPVIAHTVDMLGVPPIQVAQASVLGQMTTGFPVSPLTPATFLLVSLAGVESRRPPEVLYPCALGRQRHHDVRLRHLRGLSSVGNAPFPIDDANRHISLIKVSL